MKNQDSLKRDIKTRLPCLLTFLLRVWKSHETFQLVLVVKINYNL